VIVVEKLSKRKSRIYKAWRDAVIERDGCCQYFGCGETKRLQAHHIKTFRNNPEARFSLSNGITYCKKHHQLVEGRGGEESERIHNPLQYIKPKGHNEHQLRTVWEDNSSPERKRLF